MVSGIQRRENRKSNLVPHKSLTLLDRKYRAKRVRWPALPPAVPSLRRLWLWIHSTLLSLYVLLQQWRQYGRRCAIRLLVVAVILVVVLTSTLINLHILRIILSFFDTATTLAVAIRITSGPTPVVLSIFGA